MNETRCEVLNGTDEEVREYREQLINTVYSFYDNCYSYLYEEYRVAADSCLNKLREMETVLAYALQCDGDPRDEYAEKINDRIVEYLKAQPDDYFEKLMDEHEDPRDLYEVLDIMYDIYNKIDIEIPDEIIDFDKHKFLEEFQWDYKDDKLWKRIVDEYKYNLWEDVDDEDELKMIEKKLLGLSMEERREIEEAAEDYYYSMDPDEFRPNGSHNILEQDCDWEDYVAEALDNIDLYDYIE